MRIPSLSLSTLASSTLTLTLIATPLVLASGCSSFDTFVDDNKSKLDITITDNYAFPAAFDIGAVMGAAAGKPAPAAISQDLAPPPAGIDLVAEIPALSDAKGRVKSFEITKITVTPTTNTLTAALPAFDLYIGPLGAKDISGSKKIATIPSVQPGSKTAVIAALDAAGMKEAQQWLTQLAFSQGMKATLTVAKGANVPGGKADLNIDMALKIVLNPIK